jgi:hypothetical protein
MSRLSARRPPPVAPPPAPTSPAPVAVVPLFPPEGAAVHPAYEDRFLRACENVRVELRMISPDWATEILTTKNTHNRRLSTAWQKIHSAISRGAWHVNGECIVFDTAGVLINGQHRLYAIAKGAAAVPCFVVYGVDPEAFATFDQGKKRSAADVLSAEGFESTKYTAAALGWRMAYEDGTLGTSGCRVVPNDRVMALSAEYPGLVEAAVWAQGHYTRLAPPAMIGFLRSVLLERDPAAAEEFLRKVIKGVGITEASWEFALRRRLEDMSGRRAEADQFELCALFIKAWNKLRAGEPASTKSVLVWKTTEAFPEIA